MTIREEIEAREAQYLSPYATLSRSSAGRDRQEEPDDIRPCFQRDRDRILHSKSFRRLKHKTQVFLAPSGDHYRTRLTHTLEVSQIARTLARSLRLNEDLTEAIALGHDLGHTPFGHAGERMLNELCPEGFAHAEQSLRIVERLEKKGLGLNLTGEVRDGIVNHRVSGHPATLEGRLVQLSDKIAYISHDIDDAKTAGLLTEDMLPAECTAVLGHSVRERLNSMILGVIETSRDQREVSMDEDVWEAMMSLRRFMFLHIYQNSKPKEEEKKAMALVGQLYGYYMAHTEELPREYVENVWMNGESWSRAVCDYISGMTDDYAIHVYESLFIPRGWKS